MDTISEFAHTQRLRRERKGLCMRDNKAHKRQHLHREEQIRSFVASASAGDIEAMRAQVAAGLDLNGWDQFGDTLLEQVISRLDLDLDASRYEVVQEMLRLGADPCRLSKDGSSPLFVAVLDMDTEMLRILLDGGANPNALLRITLGADRDAGGVEMDALDDSLYDWADFAYRYEVWQLRLPEEASAAERSSEDAWLGYLDRLAVQHGKRRPDHLRLLRERGALSMAELRRRHPPTSAPAQQAAPPLNRLDRPRDGYRRYPPRACQYPRGAAHR